MCGIVGILGKIEEPASTVIKGLEKLEYRGYDSVGVVFLDDKDEFVVEKASTRIKDFKPQFLEKYSAYPISICVGHTRWATHGVANTLNAHPHVDMTEQFSLVHNGIIENFSEIKDFLAKNNITLYSQTDTEVIVNLIAYYFKGDVLDAIKQAAKMLVGSYAIAIIYKGQKDTLYCVKYKQPLILGKQGNNFFLSSDVMGLPEFTEKIAFMEDGQIAVLKEVKTADDNLGVFNFVTQKEEETHFIPYRFSAKDISKGDFPHFMLKEINEQVDVIRSMLISKVEADKHIVHFSELNADTVDKFKEIDEIIFVACGTSYHACLTAQYFIETTTPIRVSVEFASEFLYRDISFPKNAMLIALSQSGETADTLEAIHKVKNKGGYVVSICNTTNSTMARLTDDFIYLNAGVEISVASTKAFTAQVLITMLLGCFINQIKGHKNPKIDAILDAMLLLPEQIRTIIDTQTNNIDILSKFFIDKKGALFLARLNNYPIALEGALKMKEISYLFCHAYPFGEMKHGPIALIDGSVISVVIATNSPVQKKIMSNIQEITARAGQVIIIASEGNNEIEQLSKDIIYVPDTLPEVSPILNVVPLQLMSYYAAVKKGCDIDKPRNLAKSVTVE